MKSPSLWSLPNLPSWKYLSVEAPPCRLSFPWLEQYFTKLILNYLVSRLSFQIWYLPVKTKAKILFIMLALIFAFWTWKRKRKSRMNWTKMQNWNERCQWILHVPNIKKIVALDKIPTKWSKYSCLSYS